MYRWLFCMIFGGGNGQHGRTPSIKLARPIRVQKLWLIAATIAACFCFIAGAPRPALSLSQAEASRLCSISNADKAQAIDACTDLISKNLSDGYAHFQRGLIYADKKYHEKAIEDFTEVYRVDTSNYMAIFARGLSYFSLNKLDNAIADFDEVVRLIPEYDTVYSWRGAAYYLKGDYDRSIQDFDKLLAMFPDNKNFVEQRTRAIAARDKVAQKTADFSGKRRVALLIANAAYKTAGELPNPANDAKLIGEAFRSVGIDDVTIVRDVDRAGMLEALNSFADKADKADWAIIYFAGHGLEMDGRNFLIPVDARLATDRNVPDETVSLDRMLTSISGARQLKMIVLDACRNNPFKTKMTVANRAVSRGLARVEPDSGTLVLYAAKEGTLARDGGGANSPFAVAFAKRIAEPGVEINMAMRLVRQDVLQATDREQEPHEYGSLPPTPLYFVPPK